MSLTVKVRPTEVRGSVEIDGVTVPDVLLHRNYLKTDAGLLEPGQVHQITLEDTATETAEEQLARMVAAGHLQVVPDSTEAKGKVTPTAPPLHVTQEKVAEDRQEARSRRAGKRAIGE